MGALDDFNAEIDDLEAANNSYYSKKWAPQNPSLNTLWVVFRDAIRAGGRPAPPDMGANRFGQALVDAGVTYLNRTIDAAPTPTPDPAPTPAPSTLPVGGFSPGGMFRPTLSVFTREMEEYVAVAAGHRMMLRVDYEDAIQPCLDQGFDVLMVVGGTIRGFANLPGGSVSAYASMCAGIAGRWKGKTGKNGARLAILEVGGNEPNMNGISPAQEVEILKAATPAVKAADPTLLVSNGGLAPAPDNPPGTLSPRTYVTQMLAAGLAHGDLDVYQGHLYEDAAARGTWNTWDQTFPYGTFPAGTTIREVLDAHGMADVIIMSGESGRPDSNATVVANAYADFKRRRSAGEPVGPLLIFTMRPDWITLGTDSKYGMLDLSWNRKPAWSAAQAGIAG